MYKKTWINLKHLINHEDLNSNYNYMQIHIQHFHFHNPAMFPSDLALDTVSSIVQKILYTILFIMPCHMKFWYM
jgi:hypothetical protein